MPKNVHEQNENCLFCKIARKEEKSYIVWENDTHMAFLSIFPNTAGVTVVIPKKHHPSYAFELEPQSLVELTLASRLVANILDKDLPDTMRTGLVYEGFGVNHVHAKLFPMHGPKLEEWRRISSNISTYFDQYPGYISSHDGERATDENLKKTQYTLTSLFHNSLRLKPISLNEARQLHSKEPTLGSYNKQRTVTFGIYSDAKIIGAVSLNRIPETNDGEINYFLDESFTGRGVMTAACKAILEYGFFTIGLNAILIRCEEDNRKGNAVAQRLNFDNPIKFDKEIGGTIKLYLEYCMRVSPWKTLRADDTYNKPIALEPADSFDNNSFFTTSYKLFTNNKLCFATIGAMALSCLLSCNQKPKPA